MDSKTRIRVIILIFMIMGLFLFFFVSSLFGGFIIILGIYISVASTQLK